MNNHNNLKKKLPNHNILIEMVILGHILSNNTVKQKIIYDLHSNLFILKKHQILFQQITSFKTKYFSNNIKDIIIILWHKKLLKEIGGVTYILHIIKESKANLGHSNHKIHIKYFIKILQKHFAQRLFIQYSYSIFQLNSFHKLSIKQIHNKTIKYFNTVSNCIFIDQKNNFKENISVFLNQINTIAHKTSYILSGYKDLDRITQGFKQGDLIILAGRPSMGKTSFAINITYNLLFRFKLAVHIFSLEMSKNEILDKLISIASNLSLYNIKNRIIKKQDWLQLQNICKLLILLPININDQGDASISYIKSQCQNFINKKKQLS